MVSELERPPRLSTRLMALIKEKNKAGLVKPADPLTRLEGGLAVHCRVDLENKKILEVAAMATLFKGYESLLPGRDLQQVGMVSCTASGICGGVHATASALCLEMALGLTPPPLGIVLRNLLLSCQYLNDNCMHLFVLAGPDYSQQIIEASNPEIWHKAQHSACQFATIHDYQRIGDIMRDLNKGSGKLYKEALKMVSLARQAYTLLGGKYPHSESIIPGGVTLCVDAEKLAQFHAILQPFTEYSQKTAALWDDIFNFMLSANPAYEDVGRCPASMLDFGQWDHPDYYDGRYQNCDAWGEKRWSTPAAVIDGKLACSQLSLLNAGMEEFLDYSWQSAQVIAPEKLIGHDPNGNPISAFHPWNKKTRMPTTFSPQAYSWGSSLTWRGHGFEVGAYARLYLTALAQKIPASEFLHATGSALHFALPTKPGKHIALEWKIPAIWNAFERNRARAYALAFSLSVTLENIAMAQRFIANGETQTHVPLSRERTGQQLGVGLWGASRGFLAHWAVIADQVIDNYQIAIPSRVNVGTSTPTGELGPLEKALLNTPILESQFNHAQDFSAIDIQRAIQSFDPCMNCSAHVLLDPGDTVLVKVIDTSFPM